MSISHLSYVTCNRCGAPAQPADDAREARAVARQEGFERVGREDLCPRCNPCSVAACGRGAGHREPHAVYAFAVGVSSSWLPLTASELAGAS